MVDFYLRLVGVDTPSTRLFLLAKFHLSDAVVDPDA